MFSAAKHIGLPELRQLRYSPGAATDYVTPTPYLRYSAKGFASRMTVQTSTGKLVTFLFFIFMTWFFNQKCLFWEFFLILLLSST